MYYYHIISLILLSAIPVLRGCNQEPLEHAVIHEQYQQIIYSRRNPAILIKPFKITVDTASGQTELPFLQKYSRAIEKKIIVSSTSTSTKILRFLTGPQYYQLFKKIPSTLLTHDFSFPMSSTEIVRIENILNGTISIESLLTYELLDTLHGWELLDVRDIPQKTVFIATVKHALLSKLQNSFINRKQKYLQEIQKLPSYNPNNSALFEIELRKLFKNINTDDLKTIIAHAIVDQPFVQKHTILGDATTQLLYNPQNNYIVYGDLDSTTMNVNVRDIATGNTLSYAIPYPIKAVAINPKKNSFATVHLHEKKMYLYQYDALQAGVQMAVPLIIDVPVKDDMEIALYYSPDGNYSIVEYTQKRNPGSHISPHCLLYLIDTKTNQLIKIFGSLQLKKNGNAYTTWSPLSDYFAYIQSYPDHKEEMKRYTLKTNSEHGVEANEPLRQLEGARPMVHSFYISPNGQQIVLTYQGYSLLRVIDQEFKKSTQVPHIDPGENADPVAFDQQVTFAYNPEPEMAHAISTYDGNSCVYPWQISGNTISATIPTQYPCVGNWNNEVINPTYSKSGKHLGCIVKTNTSTASAYAKTIAIWDTTTFNKSNELTIKKKVTLISLLFNQDETELCALSDKGTIYRWDLKSNKLLQTIENNLPISKIFYSNDGSTLVYQTAQGITIMKKESLNDKSLLTIVNKLQEDMPIK